MIKGNTHKTNKQNEHAELMKKIKDNERIIFKICNSYCGTKDEQPLRNQYF